MKRNHLYLIGAAILALVIGANLYVYLAGNTLAEAEPSVVADNNSTEQPVKAESAPPVSATTGLSKAQLLALTDDDLVIGERSAPVTIIEYSSMSCTHCASFHTQVLPQLKKQYIDDGKALLVNRPFPLNEPALRASMLISCAGIRGLKFQDVLFETQESWAFTNDFLGELKKIAAAGGIDESGFERCMANEELETRILLTRQQAGELLQIDSTPSFYINGEKLAVPSTAENLAKAIDAALANTANSASAE